jgi:hypothetical protein
MRLTLSILLLSVTAGFGQNWVGTIDPARAIDWNTNTFFPGAFGHTNRTVQYTSYTASATAAQVQTGINNCPAGQFVFLNAGSYTFNNGLSGKSAITIRGAGANATKVFVTAALSCNFSGDGGAAFCISSGENNYGPSGGINTASWVAGYTRYTNVIKLTSVANLAVNSQIILDQADDTADGFPAAGDIVIASATAGNFSKQGGNTFKRSGRGLAEVHRVTAISGTNVTIWPPLVCPNFRTAQSPGAWWGSSLPITNFGLENMSVDVSAIDEGTIALFFNASDCWLTGCRLLGTNVTSDHPWNYTRLINADHITTKHNYGWGPERGSSSSGVRHYGFVNCLTSFCLTENNIIDSNPGALEYNGSGVGDVWAYNFHTNSWVNTIIVHDNGTMFTLYEGIVGSGASEDVIHGTGGFITYLRNFFGVGSGDFTGSTRFWVSSYHRFDNYIGNIIGDSSNTKYLNITNRPSSGVEIFSFGENNASESGAGNPPLDTNVFRTAFLWGNYNTVSNTVLWLNAEVPSGIANFSNSVPASQTVPTSCYLTNKPSDWWGTTWDANIQFPPHGPEVTGGTVSGRGGHANKIPAMVAWENLPNDPFYGSLNVREFNATNYVASAAEAGGGSTVVNTSSLSGGTKGLSVSGNLSIR